MNANPHGRRPVTAFTLVEILVSMTILSFLMLVCVGALEQMQKSWRLSAGKVEQFREARGAFELISKSLAQATLNNYWDYYYAATASNVPPATTVPSPSAYVRQSELQFRVDAAWRLLGGSASPALNPGHAVFFQAPLGHSPTNRELNSLLNARGYYVKYESDARNRPPFITSSGVPLKYRYRLMEYRPPAEQLTGAPATASAGNSIYTNPTDWFRQDLTASSHAVADNILLLILSPRVSEEAAATGKLDPWWLAPFYTFNSLDSDNSTTTVEGVSINAQGKASQGTQHQLPQQVNVTMVAVDSTSAQKWAEKQGSQPVDIQHESGASFTSAPSYRSDLKRLKAYLTAEKLNFRVFTSGVTLRNAKWDGRKR